MNQYFFKMSQAEKNNILDQHKTIYDGYVTQFGQQSNTQPLYVQDYANDKGGLVVSNKGNVKSYTNVGINESHIPLDKIADGHQDLKNGTVDFDDVKSGKEYDFFSAGSPKEEIFSLDFDELEEEELNLDMIDREFEFADEEDDDDKEIDFYDKLSSDLVQDVPDDLKENFVERLEESLSMFKRIIK